jgi:hypothetical protein
VLPEDTEALMVYVLPEHINWGLIFELNGRVKEGPGLFIVKEAVLIQPVEASVPVTIIVDSPIGKVLPLITFVEELGEFPAFQT